MAPAAMTVPAGSFETLRSTHQSSEAGQSAPEHWSVLEREFWADGVGLVASTWNSAYDDQDPQAITESLDGLGNRFYLGFINSGEGLIQKEPCGVHPQG